MNKQRVKSSVLYKNFQVLKMVFSFCKPLIFLSIIYILFSVVNSLLKVFIVTYAIEMVISKAPINDIILIIGGFVLLEITSLFFQVLYEEFFETKYRNVYIKKMQIFLYHKVKYIDMEEYDNPVFYNKFFRALRDSQWRGFRVYRTMIDFIKSICVVLALGTYLAVTDIFLLLIIMLSAIISLFAINKINGLWYLLFKETATGNRFYWYINRTFYSKRYQAELKTTDVSELLIDKYENSVASVTEINRKIKKKMVPYEGLNSFAVSIVSQGLSYIYLGYRLVTKYLSISSFSASVNACLQFSNNFLNTARIYTSLKEHARYIDDFLWVVNYQPQLELDEGINVGPFENLVISNLCFKYQGTDQEVLTNLSMTIHKGSRIAIVGHNGSGKTTLIKLLLKFYQKSSGDIYYNGINYDDINPFKLRAQLSVVFQDYQLYALSIAENVLMRKVKSSDDEKRVIDALDKVGLKEKVLALPDGIHTMVSREFEKTGVVFSGGEMQKMVIARVFASDASIYILDEPTASLDPLSEEQINRLILSLNIDKTIIVIAHRLSTVVDADLIYLLSNGAFTEVGTHQELLKLNGEYAKMFNTQKHLYEEQD